MKKLMSKPAALLLAAMFLRRNRFLLIDEPTNHLDMPGREVVAHYLAGKQGFTFDACVLAGKEVICFRGESYKPDYKRIQNSQYTHRN